MKRKIGIIIASLVGLITVVSLGGFIYYNQNVSETKETLNNKISTLVAHIENVSNENDQLRTSIDAKNKELESVKKNITELETTIDSLESEFDKLQEQKEALNNE